MAEFNAVANLQAEIDQSSLRSARREIERELGDVEVGVSSDRPTGGGGGPRTGGRASTAAMIEIQRRTLTAQQSSADFDEERNEILEEMLDVLEGGVGGGGGGGVLSGGAAAGGFTGGVAGGATVGGILAGGATAVGGGLLALLGGFAGKAGADAIDRQFPEARGENIVPGTSFARDPGEAILGNLNFGQLLGDAVPVGRGAGPGGDVPQTQNFARGRERDLVQQVREAGGAQNFNINPNVNVNAQGINERQVNSIVERKARQMAEEIRQQIERSVGAGASSRTAGNPAGPVGGPGSSGPTPF